VISSHDANILYCMYNIILLDIVIDNIEKSLLIAPYQFHFVIQKCSDFFIKQGFIQLASFFYDEETN
jgi:hypothetical protein